ncbi:hypothetical protein ACH5AJ_36355 [Streptomyces rochei]|uniref:hypothetical protein n=1 Tax=Streptomyces rochei TaxID=1928 RepID=UPI00378CC32E
MHRRITTHRPPRLVAARAGLTTLFLLAAVGGVYRLTRASALGWYDLITSTSAGALLVGALTTGWAVHTRKLRARAEAAEWETARLRREASLLDGEEDRALWDSVLAAGSDDDTCAFGPNVRMFNHYRQGWQQRAG